MIMDTGMQQSTDATGSTLVTHEERQALLAKLATRCSTDLCNRIETQAFERSQGMKPNYYKLVHSYFQQVQAALQARTNQQRQAPGNTNGTFGNLQGVAVQQQQGNVLQHPVNPMTSQTMRFVATQPQPAQTVRVGNPQQTTLQQMTRPHETQKFNPGSGGNTTTTIDLTQSYPIQQINGPINNDYSSLQHRFPQQQQQLANNAIRARTATNTVIFPPPASSSSSNSNDVLHQFVMGNPSLPTATANHSSSSDQLLQRMLASNTDGLMKPVPMPNRTPMLSQAPVRAPMSTGTTSLINANPPAIRPMSSSSSPSLVILPTAAPPSTVQIQPLNNVTVQQSPLNNSNGPMSSNSQPLSMSNSSTPTMVNYSSPTNRPATAPTGTGSIVNPDEETLTLLKYLKENVGRLQIYIQKFTSENNADKLRQVQAIQQQIVLFINNPTYEGMTSGKHFRDMLEKIPNRNLPAPASSSSSVTTTSQPPLSVFMQFSKSVTDFLQREPKERQTVSKRYLEPLSDVINGVPHKMIRLDGDQRLKSRLRSSPASSSFLSVINDEIHQLPAEVFSIERISVSRALKSQPAETIGPNKTGVVLRCKLLGMPNPLVPALRLHVSTSYPEQAPEILSLTKTSRPELEFSEGHPFFEQISSIFVSRLFQLPAEHTISDILHLWRQSVQTAM